MTKVLVVDDHESMRESLERLFNESGDFCVVGGISCADHAVRMCGELSPDIVFMDVCTEGGASGLRATKEVRDAFPDIKVIVMTAFDEISYAPRAKEAGAHAFIYKSRSLSEFEQTARDVMSGGGCFPEPKTIPMPQGEAPLTEREMEILRLMCKHMTNKEIADHLFISINTVITHRRNIARKLQIHSPAGLTIYAIVNNLVDISSVKL